MTVEIRALYPQDDRSAFDSGDEALNLYFRKYAGQTQFRHHIGVTYVAVGGSIIAGFVTVAAATLDADTLRLKRRMPPFPMPVLRVARLAVDLSARGLGIGKAQMRFSFELAEKMRDESGCVGVVVDAKKDVLSFYEQFGFAVTEAVEGMGVRVPRPQPMYLPLGSIPQKTS
ncbi:MAG: GNAT family N-acetyltransferase [Myxococcota bacterium]|nr:GNAT family N-acetyltransferase [Myxococcota bacterium]